MRAVFKSRADAATVPIIPVEEGAFDAWRTAQPDALKAWVDSTGFAAAAGETSLVAGPDGALARVLVGLESDERVWAYADLPGCLPPGSYRIDARLARADATGAALGWALGSYSFDRYAAKRTRPAPALVWPPGADRDHVIRAAEATTTARDLINTPTNDMGPAELAAAVREIGAAYGARVTVTTGGTLLRRNYPTIHAVGRASVNAPRLIDLRWGRIGAPKITLVGKGVCFDTGGLDLKPPSGMLRMKKDMGGAAQVIGLARMIMAARLDLRLRVLVPAVENSVAGNAFRPLDVITTRKGITVEVGNTDAEGRLVLCDALDEAEREHPELLIDCATLTGAARAALGTDLPALFCNDDTLAQDLLDCGAEVSDPLWQLPLWQPYRRMLDSKVADINNVSEGGMAGAITAALYLQSFVGTQTPWVHIDLMAWNLSARPGRPVGGEAQGMRALYALIERRFAGRPRTVTPPEPVSSAAETAPRRKSGTQPRRGSRTARRTPSARAPRR